MYLFVTLILLKYEHIRRDFVALNLLFASSFGHELLWQRIYTWTYTFSSSLSLSLSLSLSDQSAGDIRPKLNSLPNQEIWSSDRALVYSRKRVGTSEYLSSCKSMHISEARPRFLPEYAIGVAPFFLLPPPFLFLCIPFDRIPLIISFY